MQNVYTLYLILKYNFFNHYKHFQINVLKIASEFTSEKSLIKHKSIFQPDFIQYDWHDKKKCSEAFSKTFNIDTVNY